jgi:abortive infection bacteriophage resistance protein
MAATTNGSIATEKPLLSVDQQIEHLKRKGVRFDLCCEDDARAYLSDKTYYFKLASYRSLFQKRMGGEHDGEYVGLDFAYLKELASIDQQLRYALLPMTLDVEHFAKTKVMRGATAREEDGYSIVADYEASLDPQDLERRKSELSMLKKDVYCGDLYRKYRREMPVWVLLELVSFGTFIDFYLFCGHRWEDDKMTEEHYLLRQAKAMRNACAHSSNVVNGFVGSESRIATSESVSQALSRAGVSRHARKVRMGNARLQQIATLLYLHSSIVTGATTRSAAISRLDSLKESMLRVRGELDSNDAVRSSFDFLVKLFDNWF